LKKFDAAIGDGDHGANMDRGFKAVMLKLPDVADKDIGTIFKTVGMTLISTVGGAAGPSMERFSFRLG
jgi:dihydroxyacetone kinase-like protein